jgi:hypothetical protein
MMKQNLIFKDGTLFAKEYNRVVHGGRGDYVEFSKDQILTELISRFSNDLSKNEMGYYYYWLYPRNCPGVKVYYQLKTVKYADYKVGLYYVSPENFDNFKDLEKLF